jgi:hypothetical protein
MVVKRALDDISILIGIVFALLGCPAFSKMNVSEKT